MHTKLPAPVGFLIREARFLVRDVKLFRVEAPRIARKCLPGQFVILRVHETGERVPITIAEADREAGTITLIIQGIGKTTKLLNCLAAGDSIRDVVGPLGKASEIQRFGAVAVVSGGVGAAIAYPTAKALKRAGNHVIAILGARSRELLILESEMAAASHELFVTTDDGSRGERGFVSQKLAAMLEAGTRIDLVLAVGPIPMMKAVAEVTRARGIKTVASLNPIMVDGTGMCGGCRVLVDGKSQFACVDGPEFDAHQVDFDMLLRRNAMYRSPERRAMEEFLQHPEHDLEAAGHKCKVEEIHGQSDSTP